MDKSALYEGYSFFSTIILYGFGNAEHDFLEECISSMIVDDKIKKHKCRVRIIDTDEITDIIAIPSMISIINCEKLSIDDTDMITDFFRSSDEPSESAGDCPDEPHIYSTKVYFANCKELQIADCLAKCIKIENNILQNKENLRLTVLSTIKDIEGLGFANVNAIRIYRVLTMYKLLVDEGLLTKEMLDRLWYPDSISKSMFNRDISIIKNLEYGNLIYDRKLQGYKLRSRGGTISE